MLNAGTMVRILIQCWRACTMHKLCACVNEGIGGGPTAIGLIFVLDG